MHATLRLLEVVALLSDIPAHQLKRSFQPEPLCTLHVVILGALEAVLFRGELPRGDVAALLGMSDRGSRRVVSALLARGVLASESTRASLSITFPAALAARWLPGLFPESTEHA